MAVDPDPAQSVLSATLGDSLRCDNVSERSSNGGLTCDTLISALVGGSFDDVQTSDPVDSKLLV